MGIVNAERSSNQPARDDSVGGTTAVSAWNGVRNYLLQCASLILFFGTLLICSLICLALKMIPGLKVSNHQIQHLLHRLARFFVWWLDAWKLVHVTFRLPPLTSGPRILAANHPGVMDAVFLLAFFPQVTCIMRASLLLNPALWIARMAGFITNDSGPGLVREAVHRLGNGETLLIFPEGTRTTIPPVNTFKNGFALAAEFTGAPVQSIIIRYSRPFFGKGSSLFTPMTLPVDITIEAGAEFHPTPGERARSLTQRLETYFRERLLQD